MERAFKPVNWILIITGCRLYSSKFLVFNILDNLQALLLIVAHLLFVYGMYSHGSHMNITYAEKVRMVYQQAIGITFIVVLRSSRKKLRSFLKSIEKSLTLRDFKDLYRYSVIIGIPHWIFLIIMAVLKIYYFVIKAGFSHIDFFIVLYTELNSWVFGGVPALMFSIRALHFREKNTTQIILQDISRENTHISPPKVSLFIKKVLRKREDLMSLFSCLPCSWYLYIFIKSVAIFLTIQASLRNFKESFILLSIASLVEWITLVFLLVFIMFEVGSLLEESRQRLQRLSEKAILLKDTQSWLQVQNDICQAEKFEYRAWDVFSMNKSFVLGFVSSLLTFTVLFVQVINAIGDNMQSNKTTEI